MNIYVGNLSYETTEDNLQQAFSKYGTVDKASIIKDSYSSKSKGFGFVEMSKQAEAEEAIKKLNGSELNGRSIKVNQARAKGDKPKSRPRGW